MMMALMLSEGHGLRQPYKYDNTGNAEIFKDKPKLSKKQKAKRK